MKPTSTIRNITLHHGVTPINSEILISELSLNHILYHKFNLLQHKYFSFEFQGYLDSENAENLRLEKTEENLDVVASVTDKLNKDFFNTYLSLSLSNATHTGFVYYEFENGFLYSKEEYLTTSTNSDTYEIKYSLNISNSILKAENYNFWGNPKENIALNSDENIINTDQLVYLISNKSQSTEISKKVKYTITSIDPDLDDRQTVITATVEEYDTDNDEWDFSGSDLIFVDHSTPFRLKKSKENYIVLPENLLFNTLETTEELAATKYWLNSYNLWNFQYSISKHSYNFVLTQLDESATKVIYINADYSFDNILLNYNYTERNSGVLTNSILFSLDQSNSHIKHWQEVPPTTPVLSLETEAITENVTILLSWTQPDFAISYNLYVYRRDGTNSTLDTPDIEQFIAFTEDLNQNQVLFQGKANSTYFFKISAKNSVGLESELSNTVVVYLSKQENKSGLSPFLIIFIVILCIGISVSAYLLVKFKKKKEIEKEEKEKINYSDFK